MCVFILSVPPCRDRLFPVPFTLPNSNRNQTQGAASSPILWPAFGRKWSSPRLWRAPAPPTFQTPELWPSQPKLPFCPAAGNTKLALKFSNLFWGGSLCPLSCCPLLFRKCNIINLRGLDGASNPGRQDLCHPAAQHPVTIATLKMVTQPSGLP